MKKIQCTTFKRHNYSDVAQRDASDNNDSPTLHTSETENLVASLTRELTLQRRRKRLMENCTFAMSPGIMFVAPRISTWSPWMQSIVVAAFLCWCSILFGTISNKLWISNIIRSVTSLANLQDKRVIGLLIEVYCTIPIRDKRMKSVVRNAITSLLVQLSEEDTGILLRVHQNYLAMLVVNSHYNSSRRDDFELTSTIIKTLSRQGDAACLSRLEGLASVVPKTTIQKQINVVLWEVLTSWQARLQLQHVTETLLRPAAPYSSREVLLRPTHGLQQERPEVVEQLLHPVASGEIPLTNGDVSIIYGSEPTEPSDQMQQFHTGLDADMN